ncbi:mucin-19 isoform X2 [Hetaerina americana]|uniref:mucin-19 isoform X2 n=1 Tax=Hetaerina americana TaxID=62018 RepID=UPI003A7F37D4
MSVLNQSGDEQVECPLCMEPLEVDDLNFFPCTCGYQICRFCWHRIRTDENGLCPACRKAYPEDPADFKPLTQEEIAKLKAEKRQRDSRRKNKLSEGRRHLANVRVVQSNLVFVVGLPLRLADPEVLKKYDYFGKYGKIHKVVINQSTSYAGSQGPSASAYVTYSRAEEALRAIQAVSSVVMDGRPLKASLGTTKYCAHFMKGLSCPKPDCMYLHELGDREASFTKEEMQQGKHTEYERKLHEQLNVSSAPTSTAPLSNHLTSSPSPSSASPSSSSSSSSSSISLSSGSSASSIPPASLTHNHINCKEGKKLGGSSCSPPSQSLQQQSIQCLGAAPNILNQHHPPHQNLSQQQSSAWSSNGNSGTNVILAGGGGERVAGGSNRRGGKGGGNGSNSNNNNVNSQRRRHTSGDDVPKGKNRDKQQSNGMSNSGNRGSKGGPSPSPPLSSSAPRKVNSSGNGAPARGTSSNTGSLPTSLTARSQSGKSGHSSHPHAQNNSQDTGQDDLQEDTLMNQDLQNEEQLQGTQQTGNQRQGGALKGALSGLALSPRLQWRMGAAFFGAPEQDNNSFFSNHHCFPMRSIVRPQATAMSPRGSVDGVGSSAGPGTSHPSDETSLHSSPPSSPSPSPSSSSSASSPTSSSPSMALLPNGIGSSSVATSLGSNEWVSGVGSNLEGGLAIPDALPAIHSTTDWQAAFGFSNSQTRSIGDIERRSRPEFGPLGHGLEGLGMSRSHNEAEVVTGIPPGISNSLRGTHHISCVPVVGGRSVDDDLGFDPFHETQKALAEMMEKEDQQMLRSQQQNEQDMSQQCLHMNDMHREMQREQLGSIGPIHHLPQNYPPHHLRHSVGGGLGDGTPLSSSSVTPKPAQALHSPLAPHIQRGVPLPGAGSGRPGPPLPPPGFSAPNHMNAFGLGIPRPPSGAGSKILPFMGLGSAASSSVAIPGPPSPSLTGGVSGGTPFGSIMCNGPSPSNIPNGPSSNCPPSPHAPPTKGETRKIGESGAFNMREFHDGLRAILPGLGMLKGMCQHPPAHQQQQDWTALDPAIVSSTPHLHNSHSTGSLNLAHSHWAKSLEALSTIPPLNQPSSASTSQLPPSTTDHHYYRGHSHFQDFGGSSGGGWSQMNSGVHLGPVAIGGPGRYQPNLLQMQSQQQQQAGLMGGHQVHQHPFLMRPQDVGNSGPSPAAPPPGFNPLRSSKTVPEVAGMENL